MKIKGKQLEDTLRDENAPFDSIFVDQLSNSAITFKAKNADNVALSLGQPVYISGVSGTVPEVKRADADGSGSMPAAGLTADAANIGAEVYIVSFGNLGGLNTSSLGTGIVGDTVYVGTTAGSLTVTAPTGESAKLQNIGQVVREHASEGIIKVGGAGRTAATPNLNEGKFFVGNASNQSSVSAYTLPIADGDANQVLQTDGNGAVTFADASGGGVTGVTSNSSTTSVTLNANEFLISELADTSNLTVQLPSISGLSAGDRVAIRRLRSGSNITVNQNSSDSGNKIFHVSSLKNTFTVANKRQTIDIIYTGSRWDVSHIELGSSAEFDVGTTANDIVQLNAQSKLPAVDGSLLTNISASVALDGLGTGTGDATLATAGDITIDAQANDSDIILKGTDGSVDKVFVRIDGSDAGTIIGSHDLELPTNQAEIRMGGEVTLRHVLNDGLEIEIDSSVEDNFDPSLRITATQAHTWGPRLFLRHTGSTNTNDNMGSVVFEGRNNNGDQEHFARIDGVKTDGTNNAEDGTLRLIARSNGAIANSYGLLIEGDSGNVFVTVPMHNGSSSGLKLGSTLVTATAAELNIMDGVTASTEEINFLDTSAKSPTENDVLTYNGSSLAWSAPETGGLSTVTNGTSSQTLSANQFLLSTLTGTSDLTVQLPSISGLTTGDRLVIHRMRSGSSDIIINQNSSDSGNLLFKGGSLTNSVTIPNKQQIINIVFTGSRWNIASLVDLGTAAELDVGTSANQIVQLDSSAKIPAIDGSQLTNLPYVPTEILTAGGTSLTLSASQKNRVYWLVPSAGATFTITLPLTTTLSDGDSWTIQRQSVGNLVIQQNGSDTGSKIRFGPTDASSHTINAAGQSFLVTYESAGGKFYIFDQVFLQEISTDTTPQLGGDLDLNGNDIVTTSNADLELAPNGTGVVVVKGNNNSGAIKLNCEFNSHGVTIQGPAHSANATYTLTLPVDDGDADQVLKTDGSGVLSWVDQAGGGGGGPTYSAITANTTAQADYHYSCTGTITLTLPTSGISAGAQVRVKNMGTGTITIDPGTRTIDGSSTDRILNDQYQALILISTGTNWEII